MPLEGFISDKYFFSPDISLLIESNSKANILDLIKKKHIEDLENNVPFQHKKNDLFMWNIIYLEFGK